MRLPLSARTGGFTLIELLVVLGISLGLMSATVPIYGQLLQQTQLNETTSLVIQTIRLARERANARLDNSAHGIFIEINPTGDDRIVLFQGADYTSRDPGYDQVTVLDPSLSVSTTFSGQEVVFSPGLASPSQTGTITIAHSVSGSRQIGINSQGLVHEQ